MTSHLSTRRVLLLDLEADGLEPDNIWCIVCKSLFNGERYVFNWPSIDTTKLKELIDSHDLIVAHNGIEYDFRVLAKLLDIRVHLEKTLDTLVLSQLLKSKREDGHSLSAWGTSLGFAKTEYDDFSKWTAEMVDYCVNDVEVLHKLYTHLTKVLDRNPGVFDTAIRIEQHARWVARQMHDNGFYFDIDEANKIYDEISERVTELAKLMEAAFPPKVEHIQLKTKIKTITTPFNPGSVKQIIDRMWEIGWKPTSKTKGHLEAEKERDEVKLEKFRIYGWKVDEENMATLPEDAPEAASFLVEYILLNARLRTLTEWRDNFNSKTHRVHGQFNPLGTATHRMSHSKPNMGNIATKKTIKYNSQRLRDLAVYYGGRMRALWCCPSDSWLDRWNFKTCLMNENITLSIIKDGLNTKDAHQKNIEKLKEIEDSSLNTKLLLKTLIECLNSKNINVSCVQEKDKNLLSIIVTTPNECEDFCVDSVIRNLDGMKIGESLLKYTSKDLFKQEFFMIGTDMEGAHLRIFAHLIDDKDFTQALISGKKEDGTDAHSKNKSILGTICVDRDRAKAFIFSYLNGAAAPKVSQIFGCSLKAAKEALSGFVRDYPGLAVLKRTHFPEAASRGYYVGIDGRYVVCNSEHLMMGSILQNTEATLMKAACMLWMKEADDLHIPYKIVNFVHDEWVCEVKGTKEQAEQLGKLQSDAIRRVGEQFKMRCPMGGEYKIGKNWLRVH